MLSRRNNSRRNWSIDKMVVDELGCYPAPTILNDQGVTVLVNVSNLGSIPVKQQHSLLIL